MVKLDDNHTGLKIRTCINKKRKRDDNNDIITNDNKNDNNNPIIIIYNPNNKNDSIDNTSDDYNDDDSDDSDYNDNNNNNNGNNNNNNSNISSSDEIPPSKIPKTITFDRKITTLDELISLGESYSDKYDYTCNINLEKLSRIVKEIKEIKELIGLTSLKRSIVKQIVFLLLDIQTADECDMRHVVLNGDPGTGKTTVAQIIGKIYSKLGLLSKGTFTIGTRTDFVAKYLGQTEHKTLNFLEKCKGGVLFIDEVYSLGPDSNYSTDSYSKIVINTLNQFLSENSKDFICIIAGYKDDIQRCIFGRNKGMDRRFPYRYTIDGYTADELLQMFKKFVTDVRWSLEENAITSDFFSNKELFKFYGGDVRTFFEKCKELHAERAVMLPKDKWKILSKIDIKDGFEAYKSDKDLKNNNNISHLYI